MIQKKRAIKIETLLLIAVSLATALGLLTVADSVNAVSLLIFLVLWTAGLIAYVQAKAGLPGWLANSLALLAVAVTFWGTPGNDVVAGRLGLIVILLGIKFSRTKTPRDYLQIFILVIILLAGAAFFSPGVAFIFSLFATVLLLGGGGILLCFFSEDRSLYMNPGTAGTICLWTVLMSLAMLPVATAIFVLSPRSGYPVLSVRTGPAAGVTGFSDRISLGLVASIQDNNAVAFRVETGQKRIAENMLYWRGVVFDSFDGRNWTTTTGRDNEDTTGLRLNGTPVSYTVNLEPAKNNLIITLDKPVYVSRRRVFRRPDLTYFTFAPRNNPLRYSAFSITTEVIPVSKITGTAARQIPPGLERIKELEEGLVQHHLDAAAVIRTLMSFLKSGNFQYAQSSLPTSGKPLEEFLFTSRQGNCEYFASALAVMLRMAGIPARIIGGYRGGYFQERGGYYVVYQKNAHVWVEAYVAGTGWVRLDPTPARSADFTSAASRGWRFWSSVKLDVLQYYFMIFVLNYDVQMQAGLLSRLASTAGRLPVVLMQSGKHLAALVATITIIGLLSYLYRPLRRWGDSYEKRLLRAFLARMEKIGYRKAPCQGLEEFIKSSEKSEIYGAAEEFVRRYQESFYNDRRLSRSEAALLNELVRRIGK